MRSPQKWYEASLFFTPQDDGFILVTFSFWCAFKLHCFPDHYGCLNAGEGVKDCFLKKKYLSDLLNCVQALCKTCESIFFQNLQISVESVFLGFDRMSDILTRCYQMGKSELSIAFLEF